MALLNAQGPGMTMLYSTDFQRHQPSISHLVSIVDAIPA